jgi:peptide/nickel transport system ATP-binding protein
MNEWKPEPMTGSVHNPDILVVDQLRVEFGRGSRRLRAVDDVSFGVRASEVLGLVGESGSGKSTIGRAILRLLPAVSGQVRWEDVNLLELSPKDMRRVRGQMQMVFQDPSLNPRQRAADMLDEVLSLHTSLNKPQRVERIAELLSRVGLRVEHGQRFPHEFSGGQKQRLGIARALAVEPRFIIADEPVSALDVSIQAQILNLLNRLKQDLGLTMLFISHDLDVVEYLCDRVVVLYLGRVLEIAPTRALFDQPFHPYTQGLLKSSPVADPAASPPESTLQGEPPSPMNPPSGCVFRTRCLYAKPVCSQEVPVLKMVDDGRHVACLRHEELQRQRFDPALQEQ